MGDILYKNEDGVFSYRVAGICMHQGKILLQTTTGADRSFAFPGGHVTFGETNERTLIREFREELGAEIRVGDLKWVAEIFFPWGDRQCHQICLYYLVEILDEKTPRSGVFRGTEQLEGRNFELEFHWVPVDHVEKMEVYPNDCGKRLKEISAGVQHFVYREE